MVRLSNIGQLRQIRKWGRVGKWRLYVRKTRFAMVFHLLCIMWIRVIARVDGELVLSLPGAVGCT